MSVIMAQLQAEHRNVAQLLRLLEVQLEIIRGAQDRADYELMRDIMRYMTTYADVAHHPKEDMMFQRLRERIPGESTVIDRIAREHDGLATKGAAFLEVLERVVDGALVERDQFEAAGYDYVEFLRQHMQVEDDYAFPQAERQLEPADWDAIAKAFASLHDPVFGTVVSEDFTNLWEHIQREAG